MADTTLSLDPHALQANLEALNRRFPRIAAALAGKQDIFSTAAVAPTRDGAVNFRIPGPAATTVWLGRTSVPRIRAQALIERFDAGETNVLLPGIGEGSEADLLLRRFSPHRAVFIWETEPANLLLALALHDYAAAIDSERLVPVLASESALIDALLATLRSLPGHLCPDRLLVWPWQRPTEIAGCRAALEHVYRQIEAERRDQLAEIRRKPPLPAAPPPQCVAGEPIPRSAVLFSLHSSEETWAWADAMTSVAASAGWNLPAIVVRTPADIHPLARAGRLQNLAGPAPAFAILLDICRSDLSDVLPDALPAVSWLTREPSSGADLVSSRIGPRDRLIVTNNRLSERLQSAGVSAERLTVRPLPVLPACEEPPPDWADRPVDVAIVSHLWSTAPQAHGFDLPTHVKLWNAALDLLKPSLDRFTDDQAPGLLGRAEAALRMRLDNAEVRAAILRALAGPAATALILGQLTQALVTSGLKISCHGEGWPETPGIERSRAMPGPAGRLAIYRRAKCVLVLSTTGLAGWDVLLAAGAGAAVVWRTHPADRLPGGINTLLEPSREFIAFQRNPDATGTIRKLLGSPEAWRSLVTSVWDRCRRQHSPAAALAGVQAVATSSFPQTRA